MRFDYRRFSCLLVLVLALIASCNSTVREESESSSRISADDRIFTSFFGERFLYEGNFSQLAADSLEAGLWHFTRLDSPIVLYGDFNNGLPVGKWAFVLPNNYVLSSTWQVFQHVGTKVSFSLPFSYALSEIDSTHFNLKSFNDSLGKLSIVVGLSSAHSSDSIFRKYEQQSDNELLNQGLVQRGKTMRIKNVQGEYNFREYFDRDTTRTSRHLYNFYGNVPNSKVFFDFVFFHEGPNADVVKIIFQMVVNSLYVGGERFFNPYLRINSTTSRR